MEIPSGKIHAIKMVRQATDMSLIEAKRYVETNLCPIGEPFDNLTLGQLRAFVDGVGSIQRNADYLNICTMIDTFNTKYGGDCYLANPQRFGV